MTTPLLSQAAPPPTTEVVDWWLKHGSTQGFAVLFMACVLLMLLWALWVMLSLAKRWIPEWVKSSMRTHATMRAGVREVIALARQIRTDTRTTRISLGNALRGVEVLFKKNKERLGIGSDVVVWIENARREIERDDDGEPKQRSEYDKLAGDELSTERE